jgi:nitrate reductase cytochrome c-type subunit
MRYTGECTKCHSTDVIEITGNRFNANHYVYLNNWGTKYAIMDRYICTRCGYVEEFAHLDDKFKKMADELLKTSRVKKDDGFV